MMEGMRYLSGIIGLILLGGGYWIAGRFDSGFGHTAFIAGAILIAAMLISSAIVERIRKDEAACQRPLKADKPFKRSPNKVDSCARLCYCP